MRVKSKDEYEVLKRIKTIEEVKEAIPKQRAGAPEIQVKPICLLMAHMHNLLNDDEKKIESLNVDLENILRAIPSYMDIMLSQTMMLS